MVIVALVVFVVLLALVWWAVMRRLRADGVPVRASLEEDGSVRTWSAEQEREHVTEPSQAGGLERAKDRNAAQTWGPGL